MPNAFENIDWALQMNGPLFEKIMDKHGQDRDFLFSIDDLFRDFRKCECVNLLEKIVQIGDIRSFHSFISELHFAQYFIRNGQKVEFILANSNDGASPDFICISEVERIIVEVTSLSEDTITGTILGFLRILFTRLPGVRVRIDVELKEELSIPQIAREQRHNQNDIVLMSIGEFMEQFLGNILRVPPYTIDTMGVRFEIEPTGTENGCPGPIITQCIEVPEDELCRNVSTDISRKAKKRSSFRPDYLGPPYLIAYDCGESLFDRTSFEIMLYGKRTTLGQANNRHLDLINRNWQAIIGSPQDYVPQWEKIELALKNGWESFLNERRMIPNDFTYLSEPGILLTDQNMNNVTGLLFRDRFEKIRFLPNPFCSSEINLHGEIPAFLRKISC